MIPTISTNDLSFSDKPLPLLSHEETEHLLPDYAFGKLTDVETKQFENALLQYPELAHDLEVIQHSFVFVSENTIALDRAQTQRLKNLTVHIQQRIQSANERRTKFLGFFRVMVPVCTVAAAVLVLAVPNRVSDYLFNRTGTENALTIHPEDVKDLTNGDDAAVAQSLKETDVLFNTGAATLDVSASEDLAAEKIAAQAAKRMLPKETLAVVAMNTSAFQDYFDDSSASDAMTDADATAVALAMSRKNGIN
jgi:hypothetical protein